jgi:hypothetical protein
MLSRILGKNSNPSMDTAKAWHCQKVASWQTFGVVSCAVQFVHGFPESMALGLPVT